LDAVTAGRAAARTAALRAAAARDGGVKGDGGLVIVIGGSRACAAPPYLAGLAARRAGVHGVRIAAPPSAAAREAALEAHLIPAGGPELDAAAVREAARASAQMARKLADAGAHGRVGWLFGPGLGGSPQAGPVLDALAEARRADMSASLVVDGSLGGGERARRLLAAISPDVILLNRAEAAALLPGTGQAPGRGAQAQTAALAALARETGAVVVAKGPRDLVTDGERLWAVEAGHPGLARHGSGDVLAGMTAGLVAQALPGPDAAILACYLVGTAGSALARDTGPGWLSCELLDAAGAALRDLLAEPRARTSAGLLRGLRSAHPNRRSR
jgi:NAD(P)H-hydrate repair Nnr-like enzyme with NAD(P)H-hydrate dehydratase domain